MSILSRRPRLVATMLVVAALGGLAAGIAVARGGGRPVVKGPVGVFAQGKFRTITWGTSGTAALVRDASGHVKLRLGKGFTTRHGPDVWIYFARYEGGIWHGRHVEWKEVGHLRRAWGRQEYELPADAAREVGAYVAIFCGECGRVAGLALLEPVRRPT